MTKHLVKYSLQFHFPAEISCFDRRKCAAWIKIFLFCSQIETGAFIKDGLTARLKS